MSKPKHISFEELAGNLAAILNQVRTEHTSVVVEYPSGEKVLIKPFSPSRRSARLLPGRVADEGTRQQPPKAAGEPENVSSAGAMFELDPKSITPG